MTIPLTRISSGAGPANRPQPAPITAKVSIAAQRDADLDGFDKRAWIAQGRLRVAVRLSDRQRVHAEDRSFASTIQASLYGIQPTTAEQLVAVEVVAEQSAGTEVRNDSFAVGGRSRRGGAALRLVKGLELFGRGVGPPRFAAVGAVVRDRVQLAVVESGEHEFVTDDDRRGGPARHRHLPLHVLVRANLDRRMLRVGDARSSGAAELWPGGRLICCRSDGGHDDHQQRIDPPSHKTLLKIATPVELRILTCDRALGNCPSTVVSGKHCIGQSRARYPRDRHGQCAANGATRIRGAISSERVPAKPGAAGIIADDAITEIGAGGRVRGSKSTSKRRQESQPYRRYRETGRFGHVEILAGTKDSVDFVVAV